LVGWRSRAPQPAPASALSREVAQLAGGTKVLCDRATDLCERGELALACQLIEWAARAAPDDVSLREARRKIYERRAERETSLMAKGIFRSAASDAVAPPNKPVTGKS